MASTAVNRPTNVKQKEADVNQKLQLYGIYSGTSLFSPFLRLDVCLPVTEGRVFFRMPYDAKSDR